MWLSIFQHINLNQLVNYPTHTKGNVLDLVLANCDSVQNVRVFHQQYLPFPTKHFLISFDFHAWTPKITPHFVFDFSKADPIGLSSFSMDTDLAVVFNPELLNFYGLSSNTQFWLQCTSSSLKLSYSTTNVPNGLLLTFTPPELHTHAKKTHAHPTPHHTSKIATHRTHPARETDCGKMCLWI